MTHNGEDPPHPPISMLAVCSRTSSRAKRAFISQRLSPPKNPATLKFGVRGGLVWQCPLGGCALISQTPVVLPGRKSGFRAGFRPDSSRERLKIGRPAGRRNQTYTRRFVLSAQTLCRSVTRAVTLTRKLRKKTVASAWPRLSRCTKRADATRIICLGASLLVFGCVKKHGANHT